jgi:HD superfamily phosphohydrolase
LAKDVRRLLSSPPDSLDRPFLGQVVRDTICADLLDYLKRDAFFCGFSQQYDPRIYRYLRVERGRLYFEVMKGGRLRPDALTEVVNLLRLRYVLSERVYYHHGKIAAGAMISRAVEHAVEDGLRKRDLYVLRDDSLLYALRERFSASPDVRFLLDRLDRRSLHRAAYVLTPSIGYAAQSDLVARFHRNESGERERAEREIAGILRLPSAAVIVYCPSPAMALKEADVRVHVDPDAPRSLAEMRDPDVELLKEKHRALWRFYVFLDRELPPRAFERAASAAAEVIGVREGGGASRPADGRRAAAARTDRRPRVKSARSRRR